MQEEDLHKKFLEYLYSNYPRKRELISILADTLKIERESVSRRLNGKVLFTVKEIGKIAEKLEISIDHLLNKKVSSPLLFSELTIPYHFDSMDALIKAMEDNTCKLKEICKNPIHIGCLFESLPIEFYTSHEHLNKFMYFKWGSYFVKSDPHKEYAKWQIPEQINHYHKELIECWNKHESVLYIWDSPLIWNLSKEISLFYKMRILKKEDVDSIKKDLHLLLDNVEAHTNGLNGNSVLSGKNIDLYISNTNIGASCTYYQSPEATLVQYRTPFLQTTIYKDPDAFRKTYEWINSMKKVSTLISGSGAVERYIFFDEQHKIVDSI